VRIFVLLGGLSVFALGLGALAFFGELRHLLRRRRRSTAETSSESIEFPKGWP
jgi:hypothetical protein